MNGLIQFSDTSINSIFYRSRISSVIILDLESPSNVTNAFPTGLFRTSDFLYNIPKLFTK